jgi:hypothetical protein
LIPAEEQCGQSLAARIRKDADQPSRKIVGDEHHPSMPSRQPIRQSRRPGLMPREILANGAQTFCGRVSAD